MKSVSCLLCGEDAHTLWGEFRGGDARLLHRRYVRCSSCGLVYANPQAEDEDIRRYYEERYYAECDCEYMHSDAYRRFLDRRLRTIRRYVAEGNLMEVGCGSGVALDYFEKAGYSTIGIEPSAPGVEREEPGASERILRGFYPHPSLQGKKFDVVYCWHVIEHVIDPVGFLKSLRQNLHENGILVLGTENIGLKYRCKRVSDRVAGRPPAVGTSSEHTLFPTRVNLTEMVRRAGLRTVSYRAYDDDIRGYPLGFDSFFHDSRRNLLRPSYVCRWVASAVSYHVGNLFGRGGSKCELVARVSGNEDAKAG